LIPQELFNTCVKEAESDAYYKTLTTQKQFIYLLYGVITKCNSLNILCKNLQFSHNRLPSIGIEEISARSTLADANKNRSPRVFELIYNKLHLHYCHILDNEIFCVVSNVDGEKRVELIDSSTITLFGELFKGRVETALQEQKRAG
jgi:hypothetical protein